MKNTCTECNIKNLLILYFIILIIFLIGVSLNNLAVQKNDCKMPVLFWEYEINDEEHFSYTDKESISLWFLTDIFTIGNYIYSLGDALQFLGIGLFILLLLFTIHKTIWRKHDKKRCEK